MKLAPQRTLRLGEDRDRQAIYSLRHAVYATELGQHPENEDARLSDALDAFNLYVVLTVGGEMIGFVSITPPDQASYSVDKYLTRDELPFVCDSGLYEVRILTVAARYRSSTANLLLMHSALRWIEEQGGTRIMAIGRSDLLGMYTKAGFEAHTCEIKSGRVSYQLMSARVESLRAQAERSRNLLERALAEVSWRLPIPQQAAEACFHGGQFFEHVGVGFRELERRHGVVNADVLDAWFPPAPAVIETLSAHLEWILRTSPPTQGEGMVAAIAAARGVPAECVVLGAGSSDLIFAALPAWLDATSRVLILDPMYGEYAHVLEQRIGCWVDRLSLSRDAGYELNLEELHERSSAGYDLIVLVNPNSPTGRHTPRRNLEAALSELPQQTRVWIDETYVDYVGSEESLERFAVKTPNVVVCKSMSKAYGLSGARAAYLCAAPAVAARLRASMPPWSVGLPGQIAAVKALESRDYYEARWAETASLREDLARELRTLGIEVLDGVANFLLCHLPSSGPTPAVLIARCREQNVFLRDVSSMGKALGANAFRVAVKDAASNGQVISALRDALTD